MSRSGVMIFAMIVGIVALIGVFAAEHIGVNGGYGWDGITYRAILRHPASEVIGRHVDSYTLQRVAPSILVGGALSAIGIEQTGARVARAFGIYNVLLLVCCALLWGTASRMLGISRRGFYVGAIALFLTFANTKQVSYNPVLTDTTAFTLGLALMVAFLARSTLAVAAIAIAGSFTWPVVLPLALPLILWPRGIAPPRGGSRWLSAFVAAAIALGILAIFSYLHWGRGRLAAGMGPVIPVIPGLVPLSMLTFGAIAFGALQSLLRGIDLPYVARLVRALRPRALAVGAIVAAVAIGGVATLAARNVAPPLPMRTFFGMLAITPMTRPLISVVAHFSYYGPWILLLIAAWPRIAARIQAEGAGLVAFACGSTIIAFLPESREAIFGVPLFALFLAAASDEMTIPRRAIVVMAVVAIGLTRFWVRFGSPNTIDVEQYRQYLSAHGPYMPTPEYLTYGAIAVLSGVALWMSGLRPWIANPGRSTRGEAAVVSPAAAEGAE